MAIFSIAKFYGQDSHIKTLVRLHAEYCLSTQSPLYKNDKELIEKIQHKFTKMIRNMDGKLYKNRLRYMGLRTLKERRNRQDLIELNYSRF